ncbi:MAG: lysylphosphatidylglycerol synthase transmembrane domain-containing protein [Verrucomicrobiota bacterium]
MTTSDEFQREHSWLRTGLRSAVSIGLAVFLVHMTLRTAQTDLRTAADVRVGFLLLALLLYSGVLLINMLRWRILLTVQDIQVGFGEIARLVMVGTFFNLAIPGGTGGDVVRMAAISRSAGPGRRTEAVFSVLVDRLLGFLGLCVLAGFAVILCLDVLMDLGPQHAIVRFGAYLAGILAAVGGGVLLAAEFHQALLRAPVVRHLVQWGNRKLPAGITDTLKRTIMALDTYRRRRGAVTCAIGLSLAMHTLLALTLYMVGLAAGETPVAVREYFMTMQVGNAVGSVPITPAGIGARDMIISTFLQAFGAGSKQAAATSVLFTAVLIVGGLAGGVVFALVPAELSEN